MASSLHLRARVRHRGKDEQRYGKRATQLGLSDERFAATVVRVFGSIPFSISTLAVTSLTSQNRGSMSAELGDEQSAG
jgi:hypothetical protein